MIPIKLLVLGSLAFLCMIGTAAVFLLVFSGQTASMADTMGKVSDTQAMDVSKCISTCTLTQNFFLSSQNADATCQSFSALWEKNGCLDFEIFCDVNGDGDAEDANCDFGSAEIETCACG